MCPFVHAFHITKKGCMYDWDCEIAVTKKWIYFTDTLSWFEDWWEKASMPFLWHTRPWYYKYNYERSFRTDNRRQIWNEGVILVNIKCTYNLTIIWTKYYITSNWNDKCDNNSTVNYDDIAHILECSLVLHRAIHM